MRRVLLVDDDEAVLEGLRKALRVQPDWTVEVAPGGRAALETLARQAYDAVVTDARMPGVDGEALLRTLRERWPATLRVVLSGEIATASAERLLALSQLLVAKPVKAKVLYRLVEVALRAREQLTDPALQALVGKLGALPSAPRGFLELDALLGSGEYELDEVASLVRRDPGISTNLLKVVNSAWFGLAAPVLSIREAVRHLGGNALRALVLAAGVFPGGGTVAAQLMEEAMVRLAIVTALGRRVSPGGWLEAASTAAVVCDVARLFLSQCKPLEWARCEALISQGQPRCEAELASFGADHALLGATALGQWALPAEVVLAVARHHAPTRQPDAAAAVALASLLAERPANPDALDLAAACFGLDLEQALALGSAPP